MRVIVAAIVGGLLMFVWGAIAHMVLPFSEKALKPVPNEAVVIEAIRGNVTENGVYVVPYLNYAEASEAEQQAYVGKIGNGPSGFLVLRTQHDVDMIPELPIEGASNVLAALVAALVVAGLAIRGYGARVGAIFAFGVVAWLSISVSQWTWYGFSTDFLISDLVDQWGGWLLAGLGMAAILKPRK